MSVSYPFVTAATVEGRLEQVVSYLRQLADELNLDAGQTEKLLLQTQKTAEKPDPVATFQAVKGLILKSADIVECYSARISQELEGKFVAQSDFGTFTQQTQTRLEATDQALETSVSRLEKVAGDQGVAGLQQQMTTLRQSAEGLKFRVDRLDAGMGEGVRTSTGFTFNEAGLTIAKADTAMENRLDETGMRVLRNGRRILTADATGVGAVDVTVENYLQIGSHARLEDYGPTRTAVFAT